MTVGWPPTNRIVSTIPVADAASPHPIAARTVRPVAGEALRVEVADEPVLLIRR